MKVLLIGGTGRLSSDTTALCVEKGFDVYLLNRGRNKSFSEQDVHYLIGDINDQESARTALGNLTFDVIIDYLTYNVETLKRRLDLFNEITRQYIFISSATVFPPSDAPISETSPIGNDGWSYCKNKLQCERYLTDHSKELHCAYTIVRPYVTYDKKRIPFPIISKKSCWNLLDRVQNGQPIVMCGDGNQRLPLTSTKDFAVGMVGLIGNEKAYGQDYNIVGDHYSTWNDVIREIEQFTGKKAEIVSVPMDRIERLIPSFGQEVMFDKGNSHTFDNRKIKEAVPEFRTTVDLHQGIMETLEYLSSEKSCQIKDEAWHAMENVVCNAVGKRSVPARLSDRWLYFIHENKSIRKLRKLLK